MCGLLMFMVGCGTSRRFEFRNQEMGASVNNKLKFLITGGAGFIGSALVRFIIQSTDHSVVVIDKLTYASNLASLNEVKGSEKYEFIQMDICDAAGVSEVLQKHQPDIIIHLAAESHVDRSIKGPSPFIETNILGTFNLLERARVYWDWLPEERRKTFRFHHVSTDEVYGDLPHPDLESAPNPLPSFSEKTAYQPSSPYSASKASSDHLVRSWGRTYGLPILVSNCSNNYGPYQFPEKLIPLAIMNVLEKKPIPVYGEGNQIRDWLYVDDHARALFLVATSGTVGETYNIGGRSEKRNLDVVSKVCEILDRLMPNEHSYLSLITFVADRPGHDMRYSVNTNKIESELGWYPVESFASGMEKTVDWYLRNEQWLKSIVEKIHRANIERAKA